MFFYFDLQVEDNITKEYRINLLENPDSLGKKKAKSSKKVRDGSSSKKHSSEKTEQIVATMMKGFMEKITKELFEMLAKCAEVTRMVVHYILFTAR